MTQTRSSTAAREAFERLRRANPVDTGAARVLTAAATARERPWLALPVDGLTADAPRRRWLRPTLLVAVLAAVFVGVAPAVGLQLPVLDFGSAQKAPPHVVKDFADFDVGAPPGMAPGVVAGETRRIMTVPFAGATHELWVAPTRQGGFCELWTGSFGGCDRFGTVPLDVTRIYGSGNGLSDGTGSLVALGGHVSAAYVSDVEVRFADHTVARPTITWVSRPIAAGFFAYDVPPEHREPGHEVTAVVALDKNGHLVTEDSEDAARQGDGPLADAVVSEEKAVATTETHDGAATLYVAPTRYDGRCAWLELAGRDRSLTPCVPHGYPFAPFALRFASTPDDVVLAGSVAEHVARVVVRYADGDLATVRPRDGFVLYLVPAAHLTAGHEATKIVGEDQTGTALNELDVGLMAAVNPCFGSLPLSGSAGRGCR